MPILQFLKSVRVKNVTSHCYISEKLSWKAVCHSCVPCEVAWWCHRDWTLSPLRNLTRGHSVLSWQARTVCREWPDCAARTTSSCPQCPPSPGTWWSVADWLVSEQMRLWCNLRIALIVSVEEDSLQSVVSHGPLQLLRQTGCSWTPRSYEPCLHKHSNQYATGNDRDNFNNELNITLSS